MEAEIDDERSRFKRLGYLSHYEATLKHLLEMLRRATVSLNEDKERRGKHLATMEKYLDNIHCACQDIADAVTTAIHEVATSGCGNFESTA